VPVCVGGALFGHAVLTRALLAPPAHTRVAQRASEAASRRLFVATLLFALLFVACETSPDLQDSRSYSRDGISFRYPGNWSVTEDVTEPGPSKNRYLFVESPGSALVAVQSYEPGLDLSVEEFAAGFHRKLIEGVEEVALLGPLKPFSGHAGNAVPIRSMVAGTPREGVEHSFAVSAGGEQVPHRFRAFRLETGSATTYLVVQAADEDWNLVAPGFDLVLGSFAVEH
jgi:hypothetical protein